MEHHAEQQPRQLEWRNDGEREEDLIGHGRVGSHGRGQRIQEHLPQAGQRKPLDLADVVHGDAVVPAISRRLHEARRGIHDHDLQRDGQTFRFAWHTIVAIASEN